MAHHKLDYMPARPAGEHYNPVEAGFVLKQEDWLYSNAVDYNGGNGLLKISFLNPLII